jgi:RNA polymerase sigma-70 factor (ECF subfamily)
VESPTSADRIEAIYRDEGRRAFATLVRLLGDLDRAEEALHDAFRVALERWPADGIPANPVAWLVSTGRFRAIDGMRRARRERPAGGSDDGDGGDGGAMTVAAAVPPPVHGNDAVLADDQLRLIFTCCHPSLAEDARLALTLREVCGLTTEEIARAFLVPAPTLAQRIVRAKARIRGERIPFVVPEPEELGPRLASALRAVYLVFNEGYAASSGTQLVRHDLAEEAIRLARILHERLDEPETAGLLALLLLQQARAAARTDANGDLVPLDEQDRSRWDRARIAEGHILVERALRSRRFGPYAVQAAIAAVHSGAASTAATDWNEIVGLYDVLLRLQPSPVVELNRAVAVGERDGPGAALALVDALLAGGRLDDYHLAHAARADLCRRLGRAGDARAAYERALTLARLEPERRFLAKRLAALGGTGAAPR